MSAVLPFETSLESMLDDGLDEHYKELKTRTKCIVAEVIAMTILCFFATYKPVYSVICTFIVVSIVLVTNLVLFSVASKEEENYKRCKNSFTSKYTIISDGKISVSDLDDFIKDVDELTGSVQRFAKIAKILGFINFATIILSIVIIMATLSI